MNENNVENDLNEDNVENVNGRQEDNVDGNENVQNDQDGGNGHNGGMVEMVKWRNGGNGGNGGNGNGGNGRMEDVVMVIVKMDKLIGRYGTTSNVNWTFRRLDTLHERWCCTEVQCDALLESFRQVNLDQVPNVKERMTIHRIRNSIHIYKVLIVKDWNSGECLFV